ncbi:hypothetical protein T08_12254 [Trichinella sp. T8]|nr:hypothetical protein T08_12254 [Trichinella sp. T8]
MLMAQRRRRTLLGHRWPGWKNQTVESALTACTDPADIFAIFNDITAQVENWAKSNICHLGQVPAKISKRIFFSLPSTGFYFYEFATFIKVETTSTLKKNQTVQSAMAVCIDQAAIFARFNDIAAQVEDCPQGMLMFLIMKNFKYVILLKRNEPFKSITFKVEVVSTLIKVANSKKQPSSNNGSSLNS